MTGEIRRSIDLLASAGQVIELRVLGDQVSSGYFDNPDELTRIAGILDNQGMHGVYVTLNPVRPALLSRRANRIKQRLSRTDQTTADADIVSRHWLPIDIDPVRPSGISSSDPEHEAALRRAGEIAEFLRSLGFPDPVCADSGNGAHLLYRIDLPNDPGSRDLIAGCLASLDIRFSDERCRIDTANANAGRIWKLYGTVSRKGDSTPDRPHRRSCLLSVPDEIREVPAVLLTRLARLFPAPEAAEQKPRHGKSTLDLRTWLDRFIPGYREKPYGGGSIFLLDSCPFSTAHTDGAYAIQFANGAIFAGCHHDSCGGGSQRWQDLRSRYESRNAQPVTTLHNHGKEPASPVPSPMQIPGESSSGVPPGIPPDSAISAEADRIMREGHPLRYMLDSFARDHEGDQIVAECLIMSLASRHVINSKGLHVSITGESGKGKSHTIDTILRQIPPPSRLDGRMSEKALFYMTGLIPGTVIALDDHALSDQMQEILKGVTSSFHRPYVYHTVSKDRVGQVCTIPERCVWWIAKVEGTGDDQVFNRMLTCWIDDSEDLDLRVLDRTLAHASQPPAFSGGEREENLVCQEIWNLLDPVHVIIPYAARIRFNSASNRRNPGMLLDLIRSHAALMQNQREKAVRNGIVCINATEEDFHEASRLYSALNGECGGQMTKLTRREAEVVEVINSSCRPELTISELQEETGYSNSTINKLLNGYLSRGQTYSGILEKCPALSYLDRTISSGSDGRMTQRRVRVYTWNQDLYREWKAGGSVWLLPEDDPDDHPEERDPPGDDGPGTGGKAGEDGAKRQPADPCRPKNADYYGLKEEICDNKRFEKVRAGDPEGRVPAPDCIQDLTGSPVCRSSAHDPDTRGNRAYHDDPGLISGEERSALTPGSSARAPHGQINPRDFIAVNGLPQKKPCTICGRSYTQYQERMTPERITGPPRPNRMLCSGCYEAAKVRVALSIRTIPGIIDTGPMRYHSTPTGRCSVCKTGASVWIDPGQQIGLCETCYQKEARGSRPGTTGGRGGG